MYSKKMMGAMAISALLYSSVNFANEPVSIAQQFKLFQNKYHKIYTSPEIAEYRQKVFAENLIKIQKNNAEKHSWRLEINQDADQTWEEFSEKRLLKSGFQFQLPAQHRFLNVNVTQKISAPESVDWRTHGAVTPVKNQGQCGSSWAFATTGAMEGAGFIQLGNLKSLSEQEFLDCNTSNSGCYGGQIDNALFFAMNGITTESRYPYRARVGVCRGSLPVIQVTTYSQVPQNNEPALALAVTQQPIAVGVEADSTLFQFYKSGIITSPNCGTTLNHALLIVGYGTENGVPYWLCKNSWGTAWGEQGYIKIGRSLTNDGNPGICGIASYPWTVTVAQAIRK